MHIQYSFSSYLLHEGHINQLYRSRMVRYTSIGMPKKHHIASSAEEASKSTRIPPPQQSGQKRRRTDDDEDTQQSSYEPSKERAGGGWGRNPDIASASPTICSARDMLISQTRLNSLLSVPRRGGRNGSPTRQLRLSATPVEV